MAVYTEVTDDDVAAFVAEYELGEVISLKGIAEGVENSNFLLSTTTGTYILTLYEKRVHEKDLPYFVALMEHLAARGIPCPTPLHGRDGKALRELCGRPAAIVTFLEGLWPKRISRRHCELLGAAMARMHLAGQDFAMYRPNNLSVGGWRGLLESCEGRCEEVRAELSEELAREIQVLEQAWPRDLPQGVIHGDLFPDNVFFKGDRLSGFIDFYFACNDFLAYDVAICLNAWCFEPDNAFNTTKARALLSAYADTRPFSDAELAALPLLARGSALRFLLTRLFDWLHHPAGAFVNPKDPLEYLGKLRFHAEVRGPEAYGLS